MKHDKDTSETGDQPLFGRRSQTSLVETAVDRLGKSQGTTVLWTGAGGVGKSSLLQYGRRLGERAGIPVISGKCTLVDSGRVFGPLAGHWPELQAYGTREARELGPRPGARVSEIDHFLALLEDAAPCILLVDDLQWADDATLYALLAAFGRRGDLPVFTMLARRPDPTTPSLVELAATLDLESCVETIEPLAANAVQELVTHVLGGQPTPRLTEVLARAGGNPFYLRQLLESLTATHMIVERGHDKDISGDGTPAGVLETVAARIGRLPAEVATVLEMASTFGATFDAAALAAVADLGVADLLSALDIALREHLIVEAGEQFAFSHDLMREGAYHRLGQPSATLLHTRVAEYLQASGADDATVARQIFESNQRTVEAGRLLESGGLAVIASNPELAHKYFVRALECPIEEAERKSQLMASSARALFWAGESGGAEQYLDDQLVHADTDLAVVLSTLKAEIIFIQGRLKEGAVAFKQLAQHPKAVEPGLMWADAGLCHLLEGDLAGAEPLFRTAIEVSRDTNNARALTEALAGLCWVTTLLGDPEKGVEYGSQAVAAAESDPSGNAHRAIPYMFLGQALNWADQSDEAMDVFRRGEQAARDLGVGYYEPLYSVAIAGEYARHGDWDSAVARAESVFAYSADTSSSLGDTWAYATLIEVVRRRGDVDRAAELVDTAFGLIDGGASEGMDLVLWQQSLLQHQRGEHGSAHEVLFMTWDYLAQNNVWSRAREMAADAVHVALAAGKAHEAWTIAETMEAAVAKTNHHIYEATAHRCRAIVESDADEIAKAIELIKSAPRPVEVAGYYEDGAVILLKAGRAGLARPWAQEAAERYASVGARFDEQRLRRRLGEFGFSLRQDREPKPVSGWQSLTETESFVADLVATGQTSASIAEAMGVSRRTVESHLYRIYPKLGVANRVELVVASASR